ncbi:MAG: DUF2726 domain-containing protein [Trichormus sp. ATA11-4-KO1]|jgi:hypothetical protein|nr:DUF2726 domain-containing protein [Trichormus sp. ATA11-4-KO1]
MAINIDYEQIYQLTFRKHWLELLEVVYKYSRIASTDELVMNAVKNFEDEFFEELDRGTPKDNFEVLLEKLFLLDKGKIYQLSKERSMRIVVELVKFYNNKGLTTEAYDYAKFYPNNEVCAEVIRYYEELQPTKLVTHSQNNNIKVIENNSIANVDYTTSLFKSRQEIDFFMAVREVFQMFVVYPNVAISCLIDFDKIKNNLSLEEKNFFFKGIIDCVIFDQYNNYKPIKFFELDSPYHDSPEQNLRDNYKNNILALAGQKLYRIRKISDNQGKTEFIKLIREIA